MFFVVNWSQVLPPMVSLKINMNVQLKFDSPHFPSSSFDEAFPNSPPSTCEDCEHLGSHRDGEVHYSQQFQGAWFPSSWFAACLCIWFPLSNSLSRFTSYCRHLHYLKELTKHYWHSIYFYSFTWCNGQHACSNSVVRARPYSQSWYFCGSDMTPATIGLSCSNPIRYSRGDDPCWDNLWETCKQDLDDVWWLCEDCGLVGSSEDFCLADRQGKENEDWREVSLKDDHF